MTMQPVESGHIKAIGHDPATQTMRVEFRKGAAHDFAHVSVEKHADFMASESKGAHFNKHFRNNIEAHPGKKVA
jgi:hypothetical protein